MTDWGLASQVKTPTAQDIVAPLAAFTNMQLAQAREQELQNQMRVQNAQFDAASKFQQAKDAGKPTSEALQSSGLATWNPTAAQHLLASELQGNQLGAFANWGKTGDANALRAAGPGVYNQALTGAKTQQETQVGQQNAIGNIAAGFLQNPTDAGRAQAISQLKQIGVDNLTLHNFSRMPIEQAVSTARQYAGAGAQSIQSSGIETLNKGMAEAQTAGTKAYNAAVGEGLGKARTQIQKVSPGESVLMAPAAAAAASGQNMPGIPNGVNAPQVSPMFSRGASVADGFSPQGLARTAQIESSGNPNAVNGHAAGMFQFMPGTWKQYGQGSPFDPNAATEAAQHYAADNKRLLTNALGRAPTDAELYLAHQQGGPGAVNLLSNPNATAASIVGLKAVVANGGRPDMTAGQFANLWINKFNGPGKTANFNLGGPMPGGTNMALPQQMGGSTLAPEAPQAPASAPAPVKIPAPAQQQAPQGAVPAPAAPARPQQAATVAAPATAAPIAPTPQAQPSPGPGVTAPTTGLAADRAAAPLVTVVPGMTLAQKAEQEHIGAELGKLPQQYAEEASTAARLNATVDQMTATAEGWRHGRWADIDQNLRTSMQAIANMAGVKTTTFDQPIANYEEFTKKAGELARQATKEASPTAGVMELQMVSRALPSPEMSARGFEQVAATYQGLADYKIAKQQAADAWSQTHSGSLQGFEPAWNKNVTPTAFWLARMNPDDLHKAASEMGKTPEGRTALQSLMKQLSWANQSGLLAR